MEMTILNLVFIVFFNIIFYRINISNYSFDRYGAAAMEKDNFENSIRVDRFYSLFIVLFIFILYPVFETIRLISMINLEENLLDYIIINGQLMILNLEEVF